MDDRKNKLVDSRLAWAVASLPITEALAISVSHGGGIGVVVGLGASAIVYAAADEIKKMRGGELPSPLPRVQKRERQPGEMSAFYRMTHGKDARGEAAGQDNDEEEETGVAPSKFLMDDVLDVIRAFNRQGSIYFGASLQGAAVVHLHDLIHVLDVTTTGNGKSNRLRLIMPQVAKLASVYYINPAANKIKPVKDSRQYEIWTPVYDLLAESVKKSGDEIADLLARVAGEIERRNALEEQEDFSWQENTIVLFVDEMPEVNARCPQAADYLDQIARMGRQYNIILYLCSQTAQVKDIGLSGASQAQFKTKIYGGGDQISASRTMKGNISKDHERILNTERGLTIMLASGIHHQFVRSPLVTNEALFEYLDLPPFDLSQWVFTTSRATSTGSRITGLSTSLSTSKEGQHDPVYERNKEGLKRKNGAGGSGPEAAEAVEVDSEVDQEAEEILLSDREQQIIDLFIVEGLGMREIAIKLSGADGGNAYQKVAREVTDVLRTYMKSLRG